MYNQTIRIYQIYFDDSQVEKLDTDLIPYDNSHATGTKEYEFGVLVENYKNQNYLSAEYTGFVSWKFNEKTNISGREFKRFIRSNLDYDVYFINPFPAEARWKNVWLQGESCHPGILEFTQKILNKLDYNIDLTSFENNINTLLYCNFWVGNKKFWDEYMSFVIPVYNYIRHDIDPKEKNILTKRADRIIDADMFPFIFERMFSTFLMCHTGNIRYLPYQQSPCLKQKKPGLKGCTWSDL